MDLTSCDKLQECLELRITLKSLSLSLVIVECHTIVASLKKDII
jgi:hypothetical protein